MAVRNVNKMTLTQKEKSRKVQIALDNGVVEYQDTKTKNRLVPKKLSMR